MAFNRTCRSVTGLVDEGQSFAILADGGITLNWLTLLSAFIVPSNVRYIASGIMTSGLYM
jgi:hypothetical protein